MHLTLEARDPAGAALAPERDASVDAWSSWSPQVSSVVTTGPRRIATGLRGAVRGVPLGDRHLLAVFFEVVPVDERERRWSRSDAW